jgi:chromosomal replication initiator protein
MATSPATLLSDILGQVRLSHPELVRGWFTDISLGSIDCGVMKIEVRNRAQGRYLEQHCQAAFTEAAQAATGCLVTVTFDPVGTEGDEDAEGPLSFGVGTEELQLNPDYTFDHFVTGPCNRLAHAAALAIAEEPGRAYNPFFVYGPVGLGKTHLMQSVCHSTKPGFQYHYISCETFINHFIEAVENGALHQFRYRYRHVDGLVIDDVQFLAERERSQEEFFHTFNTLHQSHRQIILSADCSPGEIPSLEERLVSRFNSGLVALLDRPCFETRMAIVRTKAKLRCIEVPEDVVQFIASRVDTNIRELEGSLIKIDALSQSQSCPITLELARETLGPDPSRPVMISTILDVVARRFNVRVSDIQGKKRAKTFTLPRHVCMFLARQLTSQSLEQIGGYFGNRDHTTVLHASRAIGEAVKNDPGLGRLVEQTAEEAKHAGR